MGACVWLCACESLNAPQDRAQGGAAEAPAAPPAPNGNGARRVGATPTGRLRDATEVQAALFGYADTYISLTSEAADKLIAAAATPQRRVEAIRMKLDGASDVVRIVTGPNTTVALMDLAVMVTVQRQVWDEHWATQVFTGPDGESYTNAMRRLDREIWRIVGQSISESDAVALQELAANMRRWYRTQVHVTSIRASSASRNINNDPSFRAPASLLSLFGMDPLSGLSPAVVEVTKSRLLAERVFYFTKKLPTLVAWRSELMLATTLSLPESQNVIANMDSTVESVMKIADLAEGLPNVIAHNRAQAIADVDRKLSEQVTRLEEILGRERAAVFEGVAKEREALLGAFDERHKEATAVLAELRETIQAADALSASVREVLVEVKALSDDEGASGPPGRPFDIREYQEAIVAATGTLRELNTAVQSAKELVDSPRWEEREQAIRALTADVHGRAVRLIVYASVGLALALFAGISGALGVRSVLSRREARAPVRP